MTLDAQAGESAQHVQMDASQDLDALLKERLREAEALENQGEPLTRADHIQLFLVGVALPLALLVGGWLIYG